MSVWSIKEKKLKLDKPEDCVDILGLLNASQFERVELNGNTISSPAARVLAEALARQASLMVVDISDIFTGRSSEIAPAMNAFRDALLATATLQSLSVGDNAFGPDGVRSFIDLLAVNKSLRHFNTNNTGLSPEGGRLIANALAGRLIADYDKEGKDAIFAEKKTPLLLETFIAGRSRIEDGGALALASVFERMGTLKEIRMPQNGIRPDGMRRLAEALEKNADLEIIDFNDNNIGGGDAAAAFAKAIANLKKLRIVNLGDCMMNSKSVAKVIQALSNHTTLEEVNLNFSEINDSVAALLVEAIIKNSPKLRLLEINGNELHTKGLKAIKTALSAAGKDTVLGSLSDNEGSDSDDDGSDDDGSDDERTPKASPVKSPASSAASTPMKSPAKSENDISVLEDAVKKLSI